MDELVMLSWGVAAKTVTFAIAAMSVYWMGRYYDRKNGIEWNRVYDAMESNPQSMAIYFGARLIAFCVLCAWVFG